MAQHFAELDYCQTRLGELSLRRRRLPVTGDRDIYEVKLGDEFLMSSLFTEAEAALSRLALQALQQVDGIEVVVGGLGLGYTAVTALDDDRVGELVVIEGLAPVIDWHRRGLLPLGERLTRDPRCRLVEGDFFELAAGQGFDPGQPGRVFHAILLDIDHSPTHLLSPAHQAFYKPEGLQWLKRYLQPGGVFALWSNEAPEDVFLERLNAIFATAAAHVVRFDNPFQGGESTNTVYVAQTASTG